MSLTPPISTEPSAIDFTVVIPTYNGAQRLPALLDRLRSQSSTEAIRWEVIVVDNNSTDDTQGVVQSYQAAWLPEVPLRYCLESQQGAAYARLRGVREAQGTWVGLLDDDNLPAPDWVLSASRFGHDHPQAGAYGGQIHAQFEGTPPENFKRIQSFFAIRERGPRPHRYIPEKLILPPAASVVIRKAAWMASVPDQPVLEGRIGSSMVGGEDFEIMLHMHRQGWEIWYNPAMHVYHQIPQKRLERDYLIGLSRGCGLCICQLRMINATGWQKPTIIAKILLGNLRRTVLHLLKYRQQVVTDVVAACELEFFLSSLVSPFYYLNQQWQSKSVSASAKASQGATNGLSTN